ncbi:MAG: hypothetical protein LBF59_09550 [Prevotellaceae bacterium]|jgi:hypothetical protein|nr:hypothetical protein [Prevotellaceae bacterium]
MSAKCSIYKIILLLQTVVCRIFFLYRPFAPISITGAEFASTCTNAAEPSPAFALMCTRRAEPSPTFASMCTRRAEPSLTFASACTGRAEPSPAFASACTRRAEPSPAFAVMCMPSYRMLVNGYIQSEYLLFEHLLYN